MRDTSIVLIGIQARTNSTRLPGKINLEIEGKTVLEHVIEACNQAADFLNRNYSKHGALVKVAVLAPWKDPLITRYRHAVDIATYDIPEDDVLTRYVRACADHRADYVVRITADCVLSASYLISRCVKTAVRFKYDYTSNVLIRTFMEGLDVEVMSNRMLQWLSNNTHCANREHVTSIAHTIPASGERLKVCHVLDTVDMSSIKTSIDTQDDFERAVAIMRQTREKRQAAGKHGAYRG